VRPTSPNNTAARGTCHATLKPSRLRDSASSRGKCALFAACSRHCAQQTGCENLRERERHCIPETHNLLALDSRLPNQASLSGIHTRRFVLEPVPRLAVVCERFRYATRALRHVLWQHAMMVMRARRPSGPGTPMRRARALSLSCMNTIAMQGEKHVGGISPRQP
jgi:hypothetical protein